MKTRKPYKFVEWDVPEVSTLKNSTESKLYNKAVVKHKPLSRAEKNQLTEMVRHSSYSKTGVALQGWIFPFDSVLKKFFVQNKYGNIEEVYAPDKSSIRDTNVGRGNPIKTIVEVKNQRKKLRDVS